jgi:DNA-binding Lrp family transcriptional regulator
MMRFCERPSTVDTTQPLPIGFSKNVYAELRRIIRERISVAEPPPPTIPDHLPRVRMFRPRPLQSRILQYLSQGGEPSVNAISTSLGVWRSSVQRSLKTMKREALVKDRWIRFAPEVVPKLIAHVFSITDQGGKRLTLMQSTEMPKEPYPLGYSILLYLSHGKPVTIGWLSKMCHKDAGHVRRVMKSLQNKGLVECLYSKTRTSFGHDMITHLYRITESGRKVLDAGPCMYAKIIRFPTRRVQVGSTDKGKEGIPRT